MKKYVHGIVLGFRLGIRTNSMQVELFQTLSEHRLRGSIIVGEIVRVEFTHSNVSLSFPVCDYIWVLVSFTHILRFRLCFVWLYCFLRVLPHAGHFHLLKDPCLCLLCSAFMFR